MNGIFRSDDDRVEQNYLSARGYRPEAMEHATAQRRLFEDYRAKNPTSTVTLADWLRLNPPQKMEDTQDFWKPSLSPPKKGAQP